MGTGLFKGVKIMNLSSFYCNTNTQEESTTGLGDPDSGCLSSPFNFLKVGCSGNQGEVASSSSSSSRPVRCLDCNRGQHPALSEVS